MAEQGEKVPAYDRTVFIVDPFKAKGEDDFKESIAFHFPFSEMEDDDKVRLCGQITGAYKVLIEFQGDNVQFIVTKSRGFAVKRLGKRFIIIMSTRTLEEPSYTIRYLEELRNLFMFYHHSPDWLLESECNGNWQALMRSLRLLVPVYMEEVLLKHQSQLSCIFSVIPYLLNRPSKMSTKVYIQASQLLNWCTRDCSLYSGCVVYKDRVLCNLLPATTCIMLLPLIQKRDHFKESMLTIEADDLPGGRLHFVYLPVKEVSGLIHRNRPEAADFTAAYKSLKSNASPSNTRKRRSSQRHRLESNNDKESAIEFSPTGIAQKSPPDEYRVIYAIPENCKRDGPSEDGSDKSTSSLTPVPPHGESLNCINGPTNDKMSEDAPASQGKIVTEPIIISEKYKLPHKSSSLVTSSPSQNTSSSSPQNVSRGSSEVEGFLTPSVSLLDHLEICGQGKTEPAAEVKDGTLENEGKLPFELVQQEEAFRTPSSSFASSHLRVLTTMLVQDDTQRVDSEIRVDSVDEIHLVETPKMPSLEESVTRLHISSSSEKTADTCIDDLVKELGGLETLEQCCIAVLTCNDTSLLLLGNKSLANEITHIKDMWHCVFKTLNDINANIKLFDVDREPAGTAELLVKDALVVSYSAVDRRMEAPDDNTSHLSRRCIKQMHEAFLTNPLLQHACIHNMHCKLYGQQFGGHVTYLQPKGRSIRNSPQNSPNNTRKSFSRYSLPEDFAHRTAHFQEGKRKSLFL